MYFNQVVPLQMTTQPSKSPHFKHSPSPCMFS